MPILIYALVSLADVKEALGILDNSQDSYLTNLINRATDIIEKYCNGRRFKETTYTNETYDGNGSQFLNLKHYPISAITSLQWRSGDFSSNNWDSIDSSMYTYLDIEGEIYYTGVFSRGIRNYRVSYTAGYSTIPNDLQQACITLISYLKNQTKTSGMKSESLGEYSYTKDDDVQATISKLGLDEILNAYRIPAL